MKTLLPLATLTLALCTAAAWAQPAAAPAKKAEPAADAPKADWAKKEKKEVTLKVGSEAPALSVTNWVQGTEVKSFEKGKSYVVEFWATWCGPCKKSIPHLSEMSKKYTDVTFLGMAGFERKAKDSKDDTRLPVLEKFVKDTANKLDYSVAYEADGKLGKDWMTAAGQNGIPCAFVVNGEGKIAYIGNPMDDKFEAAVKSLSKPAAAEPAKKTAAPAAAPADSKKTDDKSKK